MAMPVTIVCPSCATVVQFVSYPVMDCPSCDAPLPVPVQRAVIAGLARDRAQRPVLLTTGIVGCFLFGAVMLLFLLLAPFDIGTYTINEEKVSGPEFLRRLGLLWAANCAFLLAIAYGLLREKSWTRPLMMLFWLLVAVGMIATGGKDGGDLACSVALLAIPAGVAAWYLYRKDNVVDYYDALQQLEEASGAR